MGRYYFHVRLDGFEALDTGGEQCRTIREARAGAVLAAGELIRRHLWRGGLARSGSIVIKDRDRSTVLTLPLRSAAS